MGYLQRLLQLKYPDLQASVTLSRSQELLHHHGYVALEYAAELRRWEEGEGGEGRRDAAVIQLPFVQVSGRRGGRWYCICCSPAECSSLVGERCGQGREGQAEEAESQRTTAQNEQEKEGRQGKNTPSHPHTLTVTQLQIAAYQLELDQLLDLQQLQESLDPEEFQLTLDEGGFESLEVGEL